MSLVHDEPVFFYLLPQNEQAAQVVSLSSNAPFKHINSDDGSEWLRVGIRHIPKNPGRLVSFGCDRCCCDIILPEGFPRWQCHFFINPLTAELLLRDDTVDGTTVLTASNDPADPRFDLPDAHPRQRVVVQDIRNARIRMQNALFMLGWSGTINSAMDAAKTMSRFAPSPAFRSSLADLRERGQIVHRRIRKLGRGGAAKVYLTLNLKTGDHLAVKIFRFDPTVEMAGKIEVKREVDLLKRLSHVSSELLRLFGLWMLIGC